MDSHKICVKLFTQDALPAHDVVPVFHSWIQSHALPDHLLIDVADYAHVHQGPGVVLVSHEANFATDSSGGRPGLLYQRKQPFEGAPDLESRLAKALSYTFRAADLLENALPGKAKFRTDEILIRIADRLHAPNTEETFAHVKLPLEATLLKLLGGATFNLERSANPQGLFEVRIKSTATPPVADVAARLNTVATPR